MYAAQKPGEFLTYVLLFLSPLFAFSAFLSYKLYKAIEREERDKKRRGKAVSNAAKARHRKTD